AGVWSGPRTLAILLDDSPATWPSGKARVCKTLIVGSIPTVASPDARSHPRERAVASFQATVGIQGLIRRLGVVPFVVRAGEAGKRFQTPQRDGREVGARGPRPEHRACVLQQPHASGYACTASAST